MFIGRSDELGRIRDELEREGNSVILVYGKRRVGKSTLIAEACKSFSGTVFNYICVESSFRGNLELLSRTVCDTAGLPEVSFNSLSDLITFTARQSSKVLIVLDEYQYLKNSEKERTVDSMMQIVIDTLPPNVKLILCGSYVTVMKELLEEDDPLFGRFTEIVHLEDMDYHDAAGFAPGSSIKSRIEKYAVFGGSPYVQAVIGQNLSVEENIKKYLLPDTGIIRTYIESVILKEIRKAYDVRILEILGNGKKRYSDIKSGLNQPDNGLLDKQLHNLLDMEAVVKTSPVNRPLDRRKQFYQISDNLMRFYFTFIFGSAGMISRLGIDVYYSQYIKNRLDEFISRRYEDMAREYFSRKAKQGVITDIQDIGTYWYDDPEGKASSELDVVLKKDDGYYAYECKYYDRPMSESDCVLRADAIMQTHGLDVKAAGFICSSGFSFTSDDLDLISGEMMYL